MERIANSRSVFSRSRLDAGATQSLTRNPNDGLSDRDFEMSPKMKPTQRFNVSVLGRSNTLSVFESRRKSITNKHMNLAKDSILEADTNIKFVNDNGLPENFDIEKVKQKWADTKLCQICDLKFGLINQKHHCRRCGRCVCSKCSMQFRVLSRSNPKKYKVCDRCDLKLDNIEFENTYIAILKSEEEIIKMQKLKKADTEKKINETENRELKQQAINNQNHERRVCEKAEIDEKFENSMKEINYINKSRNLISKNVKNAEERINELNNVLSKLRSEKYNLMANKNKMIEEYEDIQFKVERVDPDFVQRLKQNSDLNLRNSEHNDKDANSPISIIDEVRNQIRIQANLEKLQNEAENNIKTNIDSEEEDEEVKMSIQDCPQSSPRFNKSK